MSSITPPTLADIERALDETVSTLVAYRRQPPAEARRSLTAKSGGLRSFSASDMVGNLEVLAALDVTDAPVEIGLKHSLKKLGKLAHALVGDKGMVELAERVCNLDPDNYERRISPIDSAWNGIGTWYS